MSKLFVPQTRKVWPAVIYLKGIPLKGVIEDSSLLHCPRKLCGTLGKQPTERSDRNARHSRVYGTLGLFGALTQDAQYEQGLV